MLKTNIFGLFSVNCGLIILTLFMVIGSWVRLKVPWFHHFIIILNTYIQLRGSEVRTSPNHSLLPFPPYGHQHSYLKSTNTPTHSWLALSPTVQPDCPPRSGLSTLINISRFSFPSLEGGVVFRSQVGPRPRLDRSSAHYKCINLYFQTQRMISHWYHIIPQSILRHSHMWNIKKRYGGVHGETALTGGRYLIMLFQLKLK